MAIAERIIKFQSKRKGQQSILFQRQHTKSLICILLISILCLGSLCACRFSQAEETATKQSEVVSETEEARDVTANQVARQGVENTSDPDFSASDAAISDTSSNPDKSSDVSSGEAASSDVSSNNSTSKGSSNGKSSNPAILSSSETAETKKISSYLQGVKSYKKGLDWTGSWAEIEMGGQTFSQFGCGVCCLANMVSTKTGEAHDPEWMLDYAIQNSSFNPESGQGALSWDQLSSLAQSFGIQTELYTTPASYKDFKALAQSHTSLLVLVWGDDNALLWKNVPGHYVNIWGFDEDNSTVFLTDSKGPTNNRKWVSAEEVYQELKTTSQYQIMTCDW